MEMRYTKNFILATFGFLVLSASAWAASSPLEIIRSAVDQAKGVLENPAYQGEEHQQERTTRIWKVVEPNFDLQGIAQSTLGVHWGERTEAEQQQFVQLFT